VIGVADTLLDEILQQFNAAFHQHGSAGNEKTGPGGFDPRKAYRLCQRFPSSAASVIRAMLLKVGRPHAEVEHAVAEASEREATRLYANVRWLTLAAAVAPLLGLLGTVWGMIDAFHELGAAGGQTGAGQLADGISKALVECCNSMLEIVN